MLVNKSLRVETHTCILTSWTIAILRNQVNSGKQLHELEIINLLFSNNANVYSYHFVDIVVNFEEFTYSVDEDNGTVELVLLLSDSLSTDVTIQVVTTDGSATGES